MVAVWISIAPQTTQMKKLGILTGFILFASPAFTQSLKPVDEGSLVKFFIKNLGITVTGTFSGLRGSIVFNPTDLAACNFQVSVDASTINTSIAKRDRDLKKENYFDVKKYPRLSFSSIKISKGSQPSAFMMNGKITIKGITKSISFPFNATPQKSGYLFKGEFDLNRRDFKVGGNSLILSDDLHVALEIQARNP